MTGEDGATQVSVDSVGHRHRAQAPDIVGTVVMVGGSH